MRARAGWILIELLLCVAGLALFFYFYPWLLAQVAGRDNNLGMFLALTFVMCLVPVVEGGLRRQFTRTWWLLVGAALALLGLIWIVLATNFNPIR